MLNLQQYIEYFSRLIRAPGSVWGEATKKRAPHKPILLLAVLDLVHRGVITSPIIDITADLIELNELFNLYWRHVVAIGQSSSIAFPFSRLAREPFWSLLPKPGAAITPAAINNTSSVFYLRQYAVGAKLEAGLFRLMQTCEGREALRDALLLFSFSEKAQLALREQAAINTDAFSYSMVLEHKSHQPLVKEIVETYNYRQAARDQGFRRLVVTTYDHRCALCGVRIVTPEQYTAVEAAHIVPWSKSQNDDIRNGLALCKLCHWAFDNGMMGVSDRYEVVMSRHISAHPNAPGFLLTVKGRPMIGPSDPTVWPAKEYLAEHRRQFQL